MGLLYHTISIRDLKIELFKVIFHRGQLPCSGLNQRTKENVIAKGRLFKVYHSNSKGCQNFDGKTVAIHSFFFYKNIFYKNIEAEICEILRIF